MKRIRTLVGLALLVVAPLLASAEPKTADDWYKEGENQYNLGNFDQAAEAFKQGFSLESVESKKSAYLYNIAQAYRQGNKCKDAAFFYKRYLAFRDQDQSKPLKPEKRAEIEQRIKELEDCARTQESIAKRPPDNTMPPDGTGSDQTGSGSGSAQAGSGSGSSVATRPDDQDDDDDDDDQGVHASTEVAPKLLSARFTAGASMINAGGLDVPVQPTVTLFAGYPLPMNDKLELDVGLAGTFTAVPFVNSITTDKHTGSFTTLLANASAAYTVAPKIGARGDLGVGALFFGGIEEMGNPFTEAGRPTSGALTMLAVRIAVSADYELAPNLIATVTPFAFSYSPAKAGLRQDISAITRIDFMAGIGYRM